MESEDFHGPVNIGSEEMISMNDFQDGDRNFRKETDD